MAFAGGVTGAVGLKGAATFAAVFAGVDGVSRTMEAADGEGLVWAPLADLVASSSAAPGLGAWTSVAVLAWRAAACALLDTPFPV